MSDDKPIDPELGSPESALPAEIGQTLSLTQPGDPYLAAPEPDDEDEGGGLDWRRLLGAILMRKWILAAGLVIGGAGAAVAWTTLEAEYTAEGSLWINSEPRSNGGDVAPIRQSGLLADLAWVELMRTYSVLDYVAVEEKLYIDAGEDVWNVFDGFVLSQRFAPGSYRLTVSDDGSELELSTTQGLLVDRAAPGEPIGEDVGFEWTPNYVGLAPGQVVEFDVLQPRDAARDLRDRLSIRMDRDGNFIRVTLNGTRPGRIAGIINSLMARHIEVAADLKRAKLDTTLAILEDQLAFTEQELADAERDLEDFRVVTITLPSDRSTPIVPGLQMTTDPVISSFFQMQIQLETLKRDRERLEEVIDSLPYTGVRIPTLESISSLVGSTELSGVLGELVEVRAELRVLRNRYSDDYPPIREALNRERTLEETEVPQKAAAVLQAMRDEETRLQTLVNAAGSELSAIPPRTIEEARLNRRVQIQETLYNELRSRVETARLAAASSMPDIQILDEAEIPLRPTTDDRIRFVALFVLGGIGGAIVLALLLDRIDARVRYPTQVSREMGLDILGSIPRIEVGDGAAKGAAREVSTAQVLEAFRELRLTLGFAFGAAGPLTFTITSPSQGEGKSMIAANLAVSFAEMGRRTLLIDGDTRRGDAHRLLGAERAPGLTDYLRDRSSGDIIQSTEYPLLDFIGSGTRGTSTPELLASPTMAAFMGTLKRVYDVIIVDSPPLAAGGDPFLLSTLTGAMAVVIRTGSTDLGLTRERLAAVSRFPIRILGAILNDVEPGGVNRYYYSAYLPGYEAGPEDELGVAEGEEVPTTDGTPMPVRVLGEA